jgi:uncharacterized HhH-GPD family protein
MLAIRYRVGPTIVGVPVYINGGEPDELLNQNPFALLVGMLLDQQVSIEWAFRAPATLKERLGHLDPTRIAAMEPDDLVAVFLQRPALHRYPVAMARRVHALSAAVAEHYQGDAAGIWTGAKSGAALLARLNALPGFGDEKAMIFLAVLGKRLDVRPPGWQAAAGPFGDRTPRSVADSADLDSLQRVRRWKQAQKAAKKDKQGRPIRAR